MTQPEQLIPKYREAADAVIAELTRHPKVIGVALCGSIARGEPWEHSDLDLIAFLAEYNRSQRCLGMGHTEDAFLHINLAFRELACVQYARRGLYPQRALVDELATVAPHTYKAYVWFVYGRKNVGGRIRRSFGFFERVLERIFDEIGPPLATAIRSLNGPVTEEVIEGIPAIYDRSADLKLLIERMVQHKLIREDGRTLKIEGLPISSLSETLSTCCNCGTAH